MPYLPQDPPVAADLDSYEFKEWLGTVQQFYTNEAGVKLLNSSITGTYHLKLSDMLLIYLSDSEPCDYILPNSKLAVGKRYIFAPNTGYTEYPIASPYITFSVVAGDSFFFNPPAIDVVGQKAHHFLATENGWFYYEDSLVG